MLEEQIKNLIKLLSEEENKEKISKSLTEIIQLISELSLSSADDFMFLNDRLQYFYDFSDNLMKSLNQFQQELSGQDYSGMLDIITKQTDDLSNDFHEIETNTGHTFHLISQVKQLLELAFLPFQSLNHNLMIFYFLTTNLNLNLAYFDKNNLLSLQRRKIREIIVQNRSEYPAFFEKLNDLDLIIKKILADLQIVSEIPYTDVAHFKKLTRSLSHLFDHKLDELIEQQNNRISHHRDSTHEHFNKIIVNLQYQDIIHQRMEHVQIAHNHVVNEISGFENIKDNTDEAKLKQFSKIKQILGIQGAQLVAINQDYETAINNILNTFQEVKSELKSTRQAISGFFENKALDGSSSFFMQLSAQTEELMELLIDLGRKAKLPLSDFSAISKQMKYLVDFFNTVIGFHDDIRLICLEIKKNNDIAQVSDPIVKKNIDQINEVSKKILDSFQEIEKHKHQFLDLNEQLKKHASKGEIVNIQDIVKDLSENIQNLSEKTLVDKKRALAMLQESEENTDQELDLYAITQKIKYFQNFDQLGAEIIDKLNNVYTIFNIEGEEFDKHSFQELSTQYTMEQERKLHNQVLKEGVDPFKKKQSDEIEGNDIEFF